MISFRSGNILDDDAQALVNPVNCVGVMGKGLALQFKQRFPINFELYHAACRCGSIKPGRPYITTESGGPHPPYIVNFPTKNHWRNPSKLGWIRTGLGSLRTWASSIGLESIAIPALGAGLGGLDWAIVQSCIVWTFEATDIDVRLYPPQ